MGIDPLQVAIWVVVFGLPGLGLAAGVMRERMPRAWLIAASSAAGAFALVLASAGAWAASCWECTAGAPFERRHYFLIVATWGTIFVVLIELAIWAGTMISRLMERNLTS